MKCLVFQSKPKLGNANLDPSKIKILTIGNLDVESQYDYLSDFVLEHSKGKMRLDIQIEKILEEDVGLVLYTDWWRLWEKERWIVPLDYLQQTINNPRTINQLVFNSENYLNNVVASAHQTGYANKQYSSVFLPDVIWVSGLHEIFHSWCSFLNIEDRTHEYLKTSGGLEKMIEYVSKYWEEQVTDNLYAPFTPPFYV